MSTDPSVRLLQNLLEKTAFEQESAQNRQMLLNAVLEKTANKKELMKMVGRHTRDAIKDGGPGILNNPRKLAKNVIERMEGATAGYVDIGRRLRFDAKDLERVLKKIEDEASKKSPGFKIDRARRFGSSAWKNRTREQSEFLSRDELLSLYKREKELQKKTPLFSEGDSNIMLVPRSVNPSGVFDNVRIHNPKVRAQYDRYQMPVPGPGPKGGNKVGKGGVGGEDRVYDLPSDFGMRTPAPASSPARRKIDEPALKANVLPDPPILSSIDRRMAAADEALAAGDAAREEISRAAAKERRVAAMNARLDRDRAAALEQSLSSAQAREAAARAEAEAAARAEAEAAARAQAEAAARAEAEAAARAEAESGAATTYGRRALKGAGGLLLGGAAIEGIRRGIDYGTSDTGSTPLPSGSISPQAAKLLAIGVPAAAIGAAGLYAMNNSEKTAAPEGVERLPSGKLKYRDEIFPGYNKPKAAPKGSKHKKRVLAKKGDKVKVVNFGARGYKHNYSAKAKKSYLARSAGIKGKDDKFSANYWSRRELWPKNQKADGSARKKTAASPTLESLQRQVDSMQSSMYGPPYVPPTPARHLERARLRRESGVNLDISRLGSKLDTLIAQQEQARQNAVSSVSQATGNPAQDFASLLATNVGLPAGMGALAAALVNKFTKESGLKKN